MSGQHDGRAGRIGGNPPHHGVRFGQRRPDRLPGAAKIVAPVEPIRTRRPDAGGCIRIGRDRIQRTRGKTRGAALPMPAAIAAPHQAPADRGEQQLRRARCQGDRAELRAQRKVGLNRPVAPAAVFACEQPTAAKQINLAAAGARHDRARRIRILGRAGAAPGSVLGAEHAARRGAHRAPPVRAERECEDRAQDQLLALGVPAPPAIVRRENADIGADHQVHRVPRIDGDDQRRIEE